MNIFNKMIFFTLLVLAGASCSTNLTNRIKEQLVVETGSFQKFKAKNIMRESLAFESQDFSLTLESRNLSDGNSPLHLLKGQMIPTGERMIFAIIDPLTQTIHPQFEFEELPSGQVKVFGKNGVYLTDEIPFVTADGLLAGKPVQYAIASKKRKTSAVASFTPIPLETQAAEGRRLSLQVSHPMMTRFWLSGTGFQPNEIVALSHKTEDRTETIEAIADENGEIGLELKPYVIGRLGGEAQVAAGDLILDYPWGTRLEKKTFEMKGAFPILFVINQDETEIDDAKIQKAFASIHFPLNKTANTL